VGPAFYTKFLYFAAQATALDPCTPMILDRKLSAAVACFWRRRLAPAAGQTFASYWLKATWSPYRYHVYLCIPRHGSI